MKLSPQIILNALKQRFSIEIPRAAGTSLSLGRPVFLTDPASPAPGRVSLCRTRPNLSAAAIILSVGTMRRRAANGTSRSAGKTRQI